MRKNPSIERDARNKNRILYPTLWRRPHIYVKPRVSNGAIYDGDGGGGVARAVINRLGETGTKRKGKVRKKEKNKVARFPASHKLMEKAQTR